MKKHYLVLGLFARLGWLVPNEFNVLALIKGEERFIYIYDDASRPDLIDAFRDLAADPAVNFSWFDAAVLTDKARQQAADSARETTRHHSRI
jgi:hypothetical protein